MSKQEVKRFFDDYVFGFIFSDIEREIALAKSGIEIPGETRTYKGGGNFLCALGLLCYTEFMGGIYKRSFEVYSEILFNAFFDLMGPDYQAFRQQVDVYKVFRCGMVHEYLVKQSVVIYMLSGNVHQQLTIEGPEFTLQPLGTSSWMGPAEQGIGLLDDGRYFFVVEQYYEDFARACRTVYDQLINSPNPQIPSPRV